MKKNRCPEMKKWSKNLVTLARRVGITYSTLKYFRRFDWFPRPREDGLWNIEATRKAIARHAQRLELKGAPLSPIEKSRLEVVCAKNELAEFRLARERGEFLPKEYVHRIIDTADAKSRSEINRLFHFEIPASCQGQPVKQIEKFIGNRLAQILKNLPQPIPAT